MTDSGMSGAARRVLVLAPNWLGDAVMTTPLLTWLAAVAHAGDAPPLAVHLAVRRAWAPLFTRDNRLAGIHVIERQGRHRGVLGLIRMAHMLRQGNFDAVILGPPSLRAGLAAGLAGIPRRIGYRSDGRTLLLTDGLPVAARGSVHYSAELVELGKRALSVFGLAAGSAAIPEPRLPGLDVIPARTFAPGPPVLALAPGTTYGEAKTWPLERVAEFVALAAGGGRRRVLLLGDGGATAFAEALQARSALRWGPGNEPSSQVIDMTGRTDLLDAVGLLKGCQAFVGNDSGLMHLAAALGTPSVGIFGSSNPEWTAPRGRSTAWLAADGFDCRPCYRPTCNQAQFCLETIGAASVLTAVDDLLGGASRTGEVS